MGPGCDEGHSDYRAVAVQPVEVDVMTSAILIFEIRYSAIR